MFQSNVYVRQPFQSCPGSSPAYALAQVYITVVLLALCNNNKQNVKEKKIIMNPRGDIKEKVGAAFVLERPLQLWHSLGFVRLSHSIPTQIVLNGWYVKPSCIWNVEEAWSGRRSCQVLGNPGILAGWAPGGRAPAPGVGFFRIHTDSRK